MRKSSRRRGRKERLILHKQNRTKAYEGIRRREKQKVERGIAEKERRESGEKEAPSSSYQ